MTADKEKECVLGCKHFYGGEIKHHKDCPFYADSLSRLYDELKQKDRLKDEYAESYHQSKLREELMKFIKWQTENATIFWLTSNEGIVNEYLKTK